MEDSFWSQVLAKDEVIKKQFGVGQSYIKIGLIFWLITGFIGLFILIGFFIIPIALFYYLVYVKAAYKYAFTNKRVLMKKGLLSSTLISVDYKKITNVHVHIPFWQKLFKTGDIVVNTAGFDFDRVILKFVQDPYKIKVELDEIKG